MNTVPNWILALLEEADATRSAGAGSAYIAHEVVPAITNIEVSSKMLNGDKSETRECVAEAYFDAISARFLAKTSATEGIHSKRDYSRLVTKYIGALSDFANLFHSLDYSLWSADRRPAAQFNQKLLAKAQEAILIDFLENLLGIDTGLALALASKGSLLSDEDKSYPIKVRLTQHAENVENISKLVTDNLQKMPLNFTEHLFLRRMSSVWQQFNQLQPTAAKNTSTGHRSPFYRFLSAAWSETVLGSKLPSSDKVDAFLKYMAGLNRSRN